MSREKIVRDNLDIVTESAEEYYCRCPFHSDSNPSFAVNKKNGLWICHGCNEKGNWNNLLRRLGLKSQFPELQDVSISSIDTIIGELDNFISDEGEEPTNYLEDSSLEQYK